ncbi:MAG: PspC domain-containing protein [Bacteroidia bacterium]|jgi:phage shock protein C|nr:PspC domain-containing protein [Bacteroidia bacterium]
MNQQRTFYRSRVNRIIGGVCGGLSERLNFDVSIIRLIFVLLALFGGGGLLIYIVLWIVVPERTWEFHGQGTQPGQDTGSYQGANPYNQENQPAFESGNSPGRLNVILGAGLIVAGILFLMANFVTWLNIRDLWPAVLIVAGLALLFSQAKSTK